MPNYGRLLIVSVAVTLFLSAAGCGKEGPYEIVKLEGTVTYKGEPLEGVIVHFRPTEGRESRATTTEGGKFVMRYTYDVYGVQKGPGKVFLSIPTVSGTLTQAEEKRSPLLAEALRKYSANGTVKAVEFNESNRDYHLDLD